MLVLVPIIGPCIAIMTVAGWEIAKTAFYLSGYPLNMLAGFTITPWINLAVWTLAF
jgi:hypothetical protein